VYRIGILNYPVVHSGNLSLVKKWADQEVEMVFIPSLKLASSYQRCPDIRALPSDVAATILHGIEPRMVFTSVGSVSDITKHCDLEEVYCGSDEVSLGVTEEYLSSFLADRHPTIHVDPSFLQWDRKNVFTQKPVSPNISMSTDTFSQEMMGIALSEASLASDWWRQVGGVIVLEGSILLADHNQHLPNEWAPYYNGDPRDACEPGKNGELCSAIHSEQAIISKAARIGMSLEGTSLYISTFPCPVCAKLIAAAGVKKVYFLEGHASLDVPEVFHAFGVEVIHVQLEPSNIE